MSETADTVTVLAVDDQATFLRTARSLIAATPGFEQVGEASSGPEALELAAELHPDLVLLDVRMPGMDGLETARRLVRADPRTVIVLTSLEEVPELPSSVAYLRKQDLSIHALRAVWLSRTPARPPAPAPAPSSPRRVPR